LSKPFNEEQLRHVLARWTPGKIVRKKNVDKWIEADLKIGEEAFSEEIIDSYPGVKDISAEQKVSESSKSIKTYRDNVLDRECLDRLRDLQTKGKPDVVERVIKIYLENTPKTMEVLADAVNECKSEVIRKSAHTLRASNANLGAMEAARLCKELEHAGRDNDLFLAPEIFKKLEKEFKDVKDYLNFELKNEEKK
jgi:histidine phosphotransfer protein HptB